MAEDPPGLAAGRALVAEACRILAAESSAETALGHVSLRIGERRVLVTARVPPSMPTRQGSWPAPLPGSRSGRSSGPTASGRIASRGGPSRPPCSPA